MMVNMPKSKTILLSIILAFSFSSLTAQKYVSAYYISLKGDTIKGTALLDAYTKMSQEIRFKAQSDEIIVLKPEMAKAVWLTPDRYFESQKVHFRNIVEELDGTYFLRYLTKIDSLTLLKFECNQHEGLYIQKKGEKITALQILNDFSNQEKDDLRKREIYTTDTISYAAQMYTFSSTGRYKSRKTYLFWLYKYFDFCDPKIMNGTYNLTEKDVKKAFFESAKCVGKQNQVKNYFRESPWKFNFGITANTQIGSKDFNYNSPFGAGFFIGYSDLRDGVSFGVNWLNAKPKATAISPSNGSFRESFITYNRKVFLREKFNFGTIIGIALLQNLGLSAQERIQGTNYTYEVDPKEQAFYSTVGISGAYQFTNNNYFGFQVIRNIWNILEFGRYSDRFQLQYEYRF
jgi:hypothetical protein